MAEPLVSVIIPVWNSPRLIRDCLTAIERQTRRKQRGEFAGELDKLVLADFLL